MKPLIFLIIAIGIIIIIVSQRGDSCKDASLGSTAVDLSKEWDSRFEKKLNDDLMKKQLESRRERLNKVERDIYIDSHKYLDKPRKD